MLDLISLEQRQDHFIFKFGWLRSCSENLNCFSYSDMTLDILVVLYMVNLWWSGKNVGKDNFCGSLSFFNKKIGGR